MLHAVYAVNPPAFCCIFELIIIMRMKQKLFVESPNVAMNAADRAFGGMKS